MDQRTFNVVASVIFMLVALLHLLRIYMGWPIAIGSSSVPKLGPVGYHLVFVVHGTT
jgi:hypothetical protein